MNHILLTDYYLFTKYPEILRIRSVWDNMIRFNSSLPAVVLNTSRPFKYAMAYLASIPEDQRMYVQIMRPCSDTAVLNCNNFIMLSAAAYAAAKYENPLMKNYRGGQEAAAGGHVDKIVSTDLAMRTTHAILGMTRSPYTYLSQPVITVIDQETSLITKGILPAAEDGATSEQQEYFPPLRPRRLHSSNRPTVQKPPQLIQLGI
jgi:hypothetical protein